MNVRPTTTERESSGRSERLLERKRLHLGALEREIAELEKRVKVSE